METLWSPWRSKYIGTFKDEASKPEEECFLCNAAKSAEKDQELLVTARRKHCFAVLNKYPYNNGHVLIAPYLHISEIEEISEEILSDIMFLTKETTAALKKIYAPHGFNIGANLGRISGAGLPGHFHMHIVPRWSGDTGFISVISDIKVVSVAIEDTWHELSKILNNK